MKSIRAIAVAFILSVAGNAHQFGQVTLGPAQSGSKAAKTAFHTDAVNLSAFNSTLRQLIQRAYGVEDYQISGPDWMQKERFDLSAKFHLAVHRESQILQLYAMAVEKNGIKFREATPGVEHANPVWGSYSGSKISMAVLAQYLTTTIGTPVTDSTGLTGVYDVTLSFMDHVEELQ